MRADQGVELDMYIVQRQYHRMHDVEEQKAQSPMSESQAKIT